MKRELLKITICSFGLYFGLNMLISGLGFVLSAGGAQPTRSNNVADQVAYFERVITSTPCYRPLANPNELSLNTGK